jgi:hypothetical protein
MVSLYQSSGSLHRHHYKGLKLHQIIMKNCILMISTHASFSGQFRFDLGGMPGYAERFLGFPQFLQENARNTV